MHPEGVRQSVLVEGLVVPALQAGLSNCHKTQGVALGYVIPALQAENQTLSSTPAESNGVVLTA